MTTQTTVKVATTIDEINACLTIRKQVFVEEQGIPDRLDSDGLDQDATHVLALDQGIPVATGRLVTSRAQGVLARIAVLPSHRGKGLGEDVVRCLESAAKQRDIEELSLHPHQYLERFYRRLGYRQVPGTSIVGEHRLITMVKKVELEG